MIPTSRLRLTQARWSLCLSLRAYLPVSCSALNWGRSGFFVCVFSGTHALTILQVHLKTFRSNIYIPSPKAQRLIEYYNCIDLPLSLSLTHADPWEFWDTYRLPARKQMYEESEESSLLILRFYLRGQLIKCSSSKMWRTLLTCPLSFRTSRKAWITGAYPRL